MPYFVYILRAVDGTYYTGQTDDLSRRLKRHQSGRVVSTKSCSGWRLIHCEQFETRVLAMRRERQIKACKSRICIEQLVRTSHLWRGRVAGLRLPCCA